VLDRLRGRDGHEERPRIGVPDVLRGEHDHPARDEARVLAALDHRREVVHGRVRVGAAHRLDERRREVVVRVRALVVDERPLARRVLDVPLRELIALRLRGLPRELEHVERRAGVASGTRRDRPDELLRHLGPELGRPAPHELGEIILRERLQLDDLAP